MTTPRKNDKVRSELPPPQQQAELNPRQLPKELQEPGGPQNPQDRKA